MGYERDYYEDLNIRPLLFYVVFGVKDGEDKTVWLHTRGMRKFGRPDISLEQVESSKIETAAQIINQMIYYGAAGAFFKRPVKLHTQQDLTYLIKPAYVDDY